MRRAVRVLGITVVLVLALVGLLAIGLLATGLVVQATTPTTSTTVLPTPVVHVTDHTHVAQISVSRSAYELDKMVTAVVTITGSSTDTCDITLGGPALFQPVRQMAGIASTGTVTSYPIKAAAAARPTSRSVSVTTNCGHGDLTTWYEVNV